MIEILVPVSGKQLPLLRDCLNALRECTPSDHRVLVMVANARTEQKRADASATVASVYPGRAHLCFFLDGIESVGPNEAIDVLLREATADYVAVVPATHRLVDREWFGKMQAPLIRAPNVGMVSTCDNVPANSNVPFPLRKRVAVPGHMFLLPRNALSIRPQVGFAADADDYACCWMTAAARVGATAWAAPSVRVEVHDLEWADEAPVA